MIASNQPRPAEGYQPGTLVRHRRYGYRGVVVAMDTECRASESWYQKNQTQPSRNQPWHHVLVHGNSTVTYAACSSLIEDASSEAIVHPLLAEFFSEFDGERYVRNDKSWPSC